LKLWIAAGTGSGGHERDRRLDVGDVAGHARARSRLPAECEDVVVERHRVLGGRNDEQLLRHV
jgi:hypothetical protein